MHLWGCGLKTRSRKETIRRKDYPQLAARARELMVEQGLTENAASEVAAEEVDSLHADSIARNIRRHLKKKVKPSVGSARAGLGTLYPVLWKRLEILRDEAENLLQTEEQFEVAAQRAALIGEIIATRFTELNALRPKEAATQARAMLGRLPEIDPSMKPEAIVAREVKELQQLLEEARDVQFAIDDRRPRPTHSFFDPTP